MGSKLKEIYADVTNAAGFKGRMRLAVMTGVPFTRAGEIPDDPVTVARFQAAAQDILGRPASTGNENSGR